MMNVRCFNSFLHSVKRLFHFDKKYMSTLKNISIEKLEKRQLLKLSGPDVMKYLQGMVSNNVQIFEEKVESCVAGSCIYTLLLNVHGRVLYDCLVYKLQNNDCYLEYDSAATLYIQKHLNIYKLKKNVRIEPFDDFSVSVAYFPKKADECCKDHEFEHVIDSISGNKHKVLAFRDPRIKELGFRLLTHKGFNIKDIQKHSESCDTEVSYDLHRYKLGVGEGVLDHPPGNCLPFETNADFLNGVSFEKGCYIGQELTARVHFTGVVRKRIMPVVLSAENEHYSKLPVDCTIINENGQNVGRFRNNIEKYGLALLKVEECLKAKTLKVKGYDINILAVKPVWWPSNAYKIKHRMQ